MADGYRFPQQNAGNFFHTQQQYARQHNTARSGTPPDNIRSAFSVNTPSPSRSPDPHSPARQLYGSMFPNHQSHQPGQHGRVNGSGLAGRGIAMNAHSLHNYQQQNNHQQYPLHHTNLQQDHTAHANIGHQTTFSSGLLNSTTPNFTPAALQNGQSGTTRGGQAQQITEHWAQQLELRKESERAHEAMAAGASHHYARAKAADNKVMLPNPPAADIAGDEDTTEILRMTKQNVQKRQAWHKMDLSGQGLRILAKPVFQYDFLKELYVSSNKITRIPPSISQLRLLEYLDASNNQLTELPPELGICVLLKQLLVFDNRIQTLPNELGYLFKLEMLGIEGNPLEPELKQWIVEKGTQSLIEHIRETAPPRLPPNDREIVSLLDNESPSAEKFKVLCYNILTDSTCTTRSYGHTASKGLSWEYRKELILQEIQARDADFVCLQEVTTDSFHEYFSMKLAYNDYKGIFYPRTRSNTMSAREAKLVDGCAIFYKAKKYIILEKQMVNYGSTGINRPDMKGQRDMFNRIMGRDHIGVVGFFENRLTGSRLIMANTHLFWDPRFADIKLVQAGLLLGEISKFAEKWTKMPPCEDKRAYSLAEDADSHSPPIAEPSKEYSSKTQIPLVICADQNSAAGSAVFEFMAKGILKKDHADLAQFSYGNFTEIGMEHPFSLKSAYTVLDNTVDHVPFTNFTPGFVDIIDHIWYSTNVLELSSLLGQVDPEYMKMVPGFPDFHHPSDHISIMAEFIVKNNKVKKALTEPDFGPSSRSSDRRRN